jgi:serine/threonine-protein kinase RsbW
METTFPATVEALGRIVAYVASKAEAAGVTPSLVQRLEVAVEEAVVNVCRHAYASRPGEIRVRLRPERNGFGVELEDQGPAFDPLATTMPDTTLGLDERAVGGLGVLLIRRLVDQVSYRREGDRNILTLAVGTKEQSPETGLS